MNVYLIPFAAGRYELYCEPPSGADADATEAPSTGLFERLLERFRASLMRLDVPEGTGAAEAPGTWRQRTQARVLRWAAERVAEQRLLWRLRKARAARVFCPDDLSDTQAAAIVLGLLQHDANRHRRWMVVHLAALVFAVIVLGPLFLIVPGVANLPAAYFAFRGFGHYLSMRGARQGLKFVEWTYTASDALTALRRLGAVSPAERDPFVHDLAARLGLAHLPQFLRRTRVWSA